MADRELVTDKELTQLVRFAVAGRTREATLLARRLARKLAATAPLVARDILAICDGESDSGLVRGAHLGGLPVDEESRHPLVRFEFPVSLDAEPVWPASLQRQLGTVLAERRAPELLAHAGLEPSKSLLFFGPPGVGKTLAARWIARELGWPLLTADLSSLMSSFLGKTGNNVREVMDYAKTGNAVLLLDEFDAIAKRRDDAAEIGELKRLVTVLLQNIDDWPTDSLLVAATNHSDLLDAAIWRRFSRVIDFGLPSEELISRFLSRRLADLAEARTIEILSVAYVGMSFSDISRDIDNVLRDAVLTGESRDAALVRQIASLGNCKDRRVRARLVQVMAESGASQREVAKVLGMSRNTIRKARGTDGKPDSRKRTDAHNSVH